jgi:hypothetical protein
MKSNKQTANSGQPEAEGLQKTLRSVAEVHLQADC